VFSELASVRRDLADRLKPLLPDTWRVIDRLEDAQKAVVPTLYFEYTEISSSADGQPLARDQVACHIDLIVATAGDNENDADAHILALTHALQQFDDIFWDTAKKERLAIGPLAWRVSLVILSNAEPTPEEE
jgi:hypothetical protein